MKKIILLLSVISLFGCNSKTPTEVLVLPTLHGAHEMNPNYTYDDLMEIMESYNPDIVGVEIRPEDINTDGAVLEVFYPQEMITARDRFRDRVFGIDFYSEDTQGEPIDVKIFRDTTKVVGRANRLAQDMKMDSAIVVKFEEMGMKEVIDEQQRMAMNYSAKDFLKGEYDSLVELQFVLEDSMLKGTPYEEYAVFNSRRDRRISQNALKLIEENPEKRILILVGANHRNRLIDFLKEEDPEKLKIVKDLDFMQE